MFDISFCPNFHECLALLQSKVWEGKDEGRCMWRDKEASQLTLLFSPQSVLIMMMIMMMKNDDDDDHENMVH